MKKSTTATDRKKTFKKAIKRAVTKVMSKSGFHVGEMVFTGDGPVGTITAISAGKGFWVQTHGKVTVKRFF